MMYIIILLFVIKNYPTTKKKQSIIPARIMDPNPTLLPPPRNASVPPGFPVVLLEPLPPVAEGAAGPPFSPESINPPRPPVA